MTKPSEYLINLRRLLELNKSTHWISDTHFRINRDVVIVDLDAIYKHGYIGPFFKHLYGYGFEKDGDVYHHPGFTRHHPEFDHLIKYVEEKKDYEKKAMKKQKVQDDDGMASLASAASLEDTPTIRVTPKEDPVELALKRVEALKATLKNKLERVDKYNKAVEEVKRIEKQLNEIDTKYEKLF